MTAAAILIVRASALNLWARVIATEVVAVVASGVTVFVARFLIAAFAAAVDEVVAVAAVDVRIEWPLVSLVFLRFPHP